MSHSSQHAGLQAHSVGETYPWSITYKGDRHQWYNTVTGELAGPWTKNPLPENPPCRTIGEWVVRFRIAGVQFGYRACAYNWATQEHGAWHSGSDYAEVLSESLADIPPVSAESPHIVLDVVNPGYLLQFNLIIPARRDDTGQKHSVESWSWLENSLIAIAGGYTVLGVVDGKWRDNETGRIVTDKSLSIAIAVTKENAVSVEQLATACCQVFYQKCVYLAQTGFAKLVS